MGHCKQKQVAEIELGRSQPVTDDHWVMVANFSHLDGDYPESPGHTCRDYWRARVENGNVTAMAPITYKAWRPDLYSRGGKMLYCEGCWHDRVVDYCKLIERISLHYRDLTNLSFSTIASDDRKKTADRIRQYNRRRDDGEGQIAYSTFPLAGEVMFLHDAGDYLPGNQLPADRGELFDLLNGWALTPKGKRAGHGLEKWATDGPKVKQPETEPTEREAAIAIVKMLIRISSNKPKKKGGGGDQAQRVGYIYGANWQLVCRLVAAHMGSDEDPKGNMKGMKFGPGDLPASELINLLDLANIDYAPEGDIGLEQEQKGEESKPAPSPEPRPLLL